MAPPRLTISSKKRLDELETSVPNLMPFHIDYTGNAPISKYLLVEPASETIGAPEPEAPKTEVETETRVQDDTKSPKIAEPAIVITGEKSPDPTLVASPSPSLARRVKDATTRFISTFRGRTIHGLKVDLPPGYIGVILRADGVNTVDRGEGRESAVEKKNKVKEKQKAKLARSNGRVTRSATQVIDVDDDMNEDKDKPEPMEGFRLDEPEVLSDQTTTRNLVPIAQFSNIILWHPDIPVNANNDEYIRSLTEWTQLAHEIHKVET